MPKINTDPLLEPKSRYGARLNWDNPHKDVPSDLLFKHTPRSQIERVDTQNTHPADKKSLDRPHMLCSRMTRK